MVRSQLLRSRDRVRNSLGKVAFAAKRLYVLDVNVCYANQERFVVNSNQIGL